MTPSPSSQAQSLEIHVVRDRQEATVALHGELDLVSADMLEGEVRKLHLAGFDRVVVDLRHVEFLDSTGLRVLLSLRNAAKRERHRLVLVPGPRQVQRLFELTATGPLFDWRD